MVTRIAVAGASGRLGTLVCEVVRAHDEFMLAAELTSASTRGAGDDADVLVDVSRPDVSQAIVTHAISAGQRVVVGTSGWSAERLAELQELVTATPGAGVIVIPNFSLGSVLGTAMAQLAAPYFDAVEIIEAHHPHKIDSPSGTAVRTAELIAAAREAAGVTEAIEAPFVAQRARGEVVAGIPVHSLRLAGVIAKQEVRFGGPGEVLTVTHDTHSDAAYRAGILATLRAVTQTSGLVVGLDRVLGLGGDA